MSAHAYMIMGIPQPTALRVEWHRVEDRMPEWGREVWWWFEDWPTPERDIVRKCDKCDSVLQYMETRWMWVKPTHWAYAERPMPPEMEGAG